MAWQQIEPVINYDGRVEDIVLAPTRKDADCYWQGKGISAHEVECIDPANVTTITNVLPLINIKKRTGRDLHGADHFKEFLIVGKGRS